MKLQLVSVLLITSVVLVFGNACSLGFGKYSSPDPQLYIVHARSGPILEPKNMSLIFDYQVSPVENIELTYINVTASLSDGCAFTHAAFQYIRRGFNITVSSLNPVLELHGTATIYGHYS